MFVELLQFAGKNKTSKFLKGGRSENITTLFVDDRRNKETYSGFDEEMPEISTSFFQCHPCRIVFEKAY